MVMRLQQGITSLEGDANSRSVVIEYDETAIELEQIRSMLAEAGYAPQE